MMMRVTETETASRCGGTYRLRTIRLVNLETSSLILFVRALKPRFRHCRRPSVRSDRDGSFPVMVFELRSSSFNCLNWLMLSGMAPVSWLRLKSIHSREVTSKRDRGKGPLYWFRLRSRSCSSPGD